MWAAHTHALDASRVTPYLAISSAEAGSGKTLLLEALAMIVPRPWLTGRTTAAVLPRKVEKVCPMLLLDESDTAFRGDKDYAAALHGILNSGYKRSGTTTLCVGQGANIDFRDFSTFSPKAFAGIAKLPDTIRTRSFPIRLVKSPTRRSRPRLRRGGGRAGRRVVAGPARGLALPASIS